jgi:chromosome segregation ATPase
MMRAIIVTCALGAQAIKINQATEANPVRKVVSLLQNMQKKVTAEGEKEEELYKKFMCYCKTGVGDLSGSIAAATTKSPQLESDIKSSEEQLAQTQASLKGAQKERSDAKTAISDATSIREKEATAFAKEKASLGETISTIKMAVDAIEKGMAGFLQTSSAAALKKIAARSEGLDDESKEELLSFLSGKETYAPKSGEITGILKQMGDEFSKTLKDAEDTEAAAVSDFDALVSAKKREIGTLTASIEAKLSKVGELGVAIVQMKNDLSDTQETLMEDKKLLAELEKGCATKDKEYEERVKTRHQELLALAETIKILNDDDALELFKKTLPSPSLAQVQVSISDLRARALKLLQGAPGSDRSRVNFLVVALRGKKVGFEKVISMIDAMIATLNKEQTDDENKKEYCSKQADVTEDKKKALERSVKDLETAITSAEEGISQLTEEIATAEDSIKALDKSVQAATEQRKEENVEFKELMQSDGAAKELLGFAKNRLNKFYNPKLYNPPAKEELSAQGAVERDMSFVQIQRRSSVEPPPATWDAYAKKSEESTGVISMIDLLIKDLDKEMTEAESEEKNSQEDYDAMMAEAKENRVQLSKSLRDKTAAKADLQADLETAKDDKDATTKELMVTDKVISNLHSECDWLIQYFDVRKEARAEEIDALKKAKAVLSGADFSM